VVQFLSTALFDMSLFIVCDFGGDDVKGVVLHPHCHIHHHHHHHHHHTSWQWQKMGATEKQI
jgi:hypothetical protein